MRLSLSGQPLVRFVFEYIPSVNDAIDKARGHWSHGSGFTKTWRTKGREIASQFMRECGPKERKLLVQGRAFLWVRVFRDREWPTYDVTNPWTKPILDGFIDAGLLKDDSWPYLPHALFSWLYDATGAGQRFELEIYELEDVTINGVAQILPSGRVGD